MSARTFAFIGHPTGVNHLQRYLETREPGYTPVHPQLLTKVFEWTPPFVMKELDDVRSRTGCTRSGVVVMATVMPEMTHLSPQKALEKVRDACVLAAGKGVRMTTLGGHTSIAGMSAPEVLRQAVRSSLTTGNTFTVAMAVTQVLNLARQAEVDLQEMTLAVLGGTGDIGSACAEFLAPRFGSLTLTARDRGRMSWLADRVAHRCGKPVAVLTDNRAAVREADVVIAATSAATAILSTDDFKAGSVVFDVGYPKNIESIVGERDDVLVLSGGMCRMDYELDYSGMFAYGEQLPLRDLLFGCLAEGLVLDFEENYCDFSMGRGNITEEGIAYMLELGEKHGFVPPPPFGNGGYLETDELKAVVRQNPRLR